MGEWSYEILFHPLSELNLTILACKIRMHLGPFVDFQLLEKNCELGGTWEENRYPGIQYQCLRFDRQTEVLISHRLRM